MNSLVARLSVAIALLCLGTAGCNTDELPPAAGFSSVSGTIVDAATNTPIHGALVTVDTVLTATSDATGRFSIDKVPSGIADYAVEATGYQALSSSTTIEPGKPFTLNLTLSAAATPPPH
ncbi:MAG TPA: carboxypeptidase regulatory-like domain-containing protein [Candidatus Cybelea sp.]|nr:carboxypeptidase regulatory-like domain-containing protein [Candidatus Cybelea sp.]